MKKPALKVGAVALVQIALVGIAVALSSLSPRADGRRVPPPVAPVYRMNPFRGATSTSTTPT